MKNDTPLKIARSAFRAGSLRELYLINWRGGPKLVACFREDWRAIWFSLRWQSAGACDFISKNGLFCVAVPVVGAINFPFQPGAGLEVGPSGQWRKFTVDSGIKGFAFTLRSLSKN